MWNNDKSNGKDGNAKEQSKSLLYEEEFKKIIKQIRMKYNKLLKKLKDGE
jgi:hypothetical protein